MTEVIKGTSDVKFQEKRLCCIDGCYGGGHAMRGNKASSACPSGMAPVCSAKGGKCGWSDRARMPAKKFLSDLYEHDGSNMRRLLRVKAFWHKARYANVKGFWDGALTKH